MAQRVIRINDLATTKGKPGRLPVSPATLWRWVAEKRFPAPFKLGPNTTVWDEDQVEAHLAQQAAQGAAKRGRETARATSRDTTQPPRLTTTNTLILPATARRVKRWRR